MTKLLIKKCKQKWDHESGIVPKIDVSRDPVETYFDLVQEKFEQNGSKFTMKSKGILAKLKELEVKPTIRVMGCRYIGMVSEKKFLLHHKIDPPFVGKVFKAPRYVFFWVQIIGSKFETKNFKYSLQVEDPEFEGTYSYKGYVKSLDDKKTDVYKSSTAGLMISRGDGTDFV